MRNLASTSPSACSSSALSGWLRVKQLGRADDRKQASAFRRRVLILTLGEAARFGRNPCRGQRRPRRAVGVGPSGFRRSRRAARRRGRGARASQRARASEAFIHLGMGGPVEAAQWQLISPSRWAWAMSTQRTRATWAPGSQYLADPITSDNPGPDCDSRFRSPESAGSFTSTTADLDGRRVAARGRVGCRTSWL